MSIDLFSGPMDLLLHLVHLQELPIEKVQMSVVARQYLEVIFRTADLDLNKAGEYLVIAATLLNIKSASLLPSADSGADETNIDLSPSALEELRERLRRYEQTKKQAELLGKLPQLGIHSFGRRDPVVKEVADELSVSSKPSLTLDTLLFGVLKRLSLSRALFSIRLEPISVVRSMVTIVDILKGYSSKAAQRFRDIVFAIRSTEANAGKPVSTRTAVIGSFVALLELARRGAVVLVQQEDDDEIEIVSHVHEQPMTDAAFFSSDMDEPQNSAA